MYHSSLSIDMADTPPGIREIHSSPDLSKELDRRLQHKNGFGADKKLLIRAPNKHMIPLSILCFVVIGILTLYKGGNIVDNASSDALNNRGQNINEEEIYVDRAQQYRKYIHAIDTHGLQSSLSRSTRSIQSHSEEPKIAFMFLESDGHAQDEIWDSFFDQADSSKYNLYVHRNNPTPNSGDFLQQYPSYHEVSITSSAWCALMGVQYSLVQAALRDPTNQQFVFVSHNAIPLKSFDYIYNDLVVDSPNTSKFCFTSMVGQANSDCRFQDSSRAESSDTLKHHQWVILSRDHAKIILYENGRSSLDYYDALRDVVDGRYNDPKMCSDETVPAIALIQRAKVEGKILDDLNSEDVFTGLEQIGVEQRCTTFAYWARCLQKTPFDLEVGFEKSQGELVHPLSMSGVEDTYLKNLVTHPSLLFARKFNQNAVVKMRRDLEGEKRVYDARLEDILPLYIHNMTEFDHGALEENKLARLNTIKANSSLLIRNT
ncbi:hypothetical protein SARC_10539 [Sphaeroforma arctica JP610]|uniref:Uncharacterized protein n=1 Tax=Sphaeroforma arctica JP610 TaxID=667725 RepID=A0A0L0FJQ2_9EUKA|nr:hypothetical protein SARC_10539 [Sphaeroforma arctica JP610]KNC76990.1 hypothetical protein SARC_10539 [Sphaeroforma arctica JP610]|eukprot:XP_014150892.1 hypothetical protein SARC_10539 [Sphaeroforma arctica JP610]